MEFCGPLFDIDGRNRPDTLEAAFAGAHGVFLVTNAWEAGADESRQALAAVDGSLRKEIRRIEIDCAIYRACIRGTDLPVRVDARLDVWMGMPHGFAGGVGELKAASQALDAVGVFLTEKLQAVAP